ncbi:MAG: hypothetical protein Q9165_000856 [Trypethelium subeluteriae]
MFYTFKYAAHKPWDPQVPWVVRHMGVYQSVDKASGETLLILINPCPGSRAERSVVEILSSQAEYVLKNPLWVHAVILSSYESQWKEYLYHYEQRQLPIVSITNVNLIVGRSSRGSRRFVEGLANVFEGLGNLAKLDVVPHADKARIAQFIDNESRRNEGFVRLAKYVTQQSCAAAQLLSNTLAFKDQEIAQQQNETMLKLTTSTAFLTLLGLFYVPWSFFAVSNESGDGNWEGALTRLQSLFATSFFSIQKTEHGGTQWQVSSLIWIYVVCSTVAMLLTIAGYYYLQRRRKNNTHHESTALSIEAQDSRSIVRRLSTRAWTMISTRTSTFGFEKETV